MTNVKESRGHTANKFLMLYGFEIKKSLKLLCELNHRFSDYDVTFNTIP